MKFTLSRPANVCNVCTSLRLFFALIPSDFSIRLIPQTNVPFPFSSARRSIFLKRSFFFYKVTRSIVLQTSSVLCCRLHGLRTPRRNAENRASRWGEKVCPTTWNFSIRVFTVLHAVETSRVFFHRVLHAVAFSFGDFFPRGLSVYLELLARNVRLCQFSRHSLRSDECEFKMFLQILLIGNASDILVKIKFITKCKFIVFD